MARTAGTRVKTKTKTLSHSLRVKPLLKGGLGAQLFQWCLSSQGETNVRCEPLFDITGVRHGNAPLKDIPDCFFTFRKSAEQLLRTFPPEDENDFTDIVELDKYSPERRYWKTQGFLGKFKAPLKAINFFCQWRYQKDFRRGNPPPAQMPIDTVYVIDDHHPHAAVLHRIAELRDQSRSGMERGIPLYVFCSRSTRHANQCPHWKGKVQTTPANSCQQFQARCLDRQYTPL